MSTKTIGGIKGEALGQSLLDIYNAWKKNLTC
jgi:hypothetical protein